VAARFWRWVLGAVLVFATASAATLAVTLALPAAATPWVALGNAAALPVIFAVVSFAFARACETPRNRLANARLAAQTVFSEAVHFSRAILTMSWNPRERRYPIRTVSVAQPARPVLLVHGILCNRAVWRPLAARLHAAGFAPVHAVNLEPLFADIDSQAQSLAPELVALHQKSHGARVAIVSHSMGGLVTRSLLRSAGSEMISRVVTIACPHHGTKFARGLRWPATRQMCPGSIWLQTLETSEGGHFPVPFASIYSVEDNLVAPAASAQLAGARMYRMRGIGHLGMLSARRALDCVMAVLSQPPPL